MIQTVFFVNISELSDILFFFFKGRYDIFNNITANVTLVQLMYSLGNVNHAISVVGSWIFDSNYEKALVLNRASLDMICASSIDEEQAACF